MKIPSHLKLSSESGFTLIQIVLLAGILGLIVTFAFKAQVQNSQTQKSLKASQSYKDINQLFTNEISRVLKTAPGGCFTPNAFTADIYAGKNTSKMTYSIDIEQGISQGIASAISGNASTKEAIARCKKPTTINDLNSASDNKIHFCMRFTPIDDPTATKNSFLNSEHAFAEVAIHLKDFHTDKPISCNAYKGLRAAGAQVFYSLYWTTEIGGKFQYKRKNGVFHTGREL